MFTGAQAATQLLLPSALASSSREIGSSLGGASCTGFLGLKSGILLIRWFSSGLFEMLLPNVLRRERDVKFVGRVNRSRCRTPCVIVIRASWMLKSTVCSEFAVVGPYGTSLVRGARKLGWR